MRLWHAIFQHYHARRALRHALLSRRHVEKGEAHQCRAQGLNPDDDVLWLFAGFVIVALTSFGWILS